MKNKTEKILISVFGIGLLSVLIQAILKKTLTFQISGFVFSLLAVCILGLIILPIWTYGIVKLLRRL